MVKLINYIKNSLQEVCPKVYFIDETTETIYPYAVFNFPSSTMQEKREDFILEIDLYDDDLGYTRLEDLVTKVDGKLNNLHVVEESFNSLINRKERLTIKEEASIVKQRKLKYIVKTYFK